MALPTGILGYRFTRRAHANAISEVGVCTNLGPNHRYIEQSIAAFEASDARGERLTVT